MFQPVNQKQSFPELELKILKFWRENDVFRQSIENRRDAKEYTFYDGPPFATGLPHYGHILAGAIKDVIPRYQTMRGYKVERRFGWDCHGLPVENLIEKELKLGDRDALLEYGIDNFNEACRSSVLRYANEWETIVERMGRWVDFQHDYKTMDPEFMESVWWVFDQLWQKGLVYEGHKPMHICPRCVTPLSNFEVNLGYKDITDQSVVAKFKLQASSSKPQASSSQTPLIHPSKYYGERRGQGGVSSDEVTDSGQARKTEEGDTYILAWTTTPWTLPGNVALAVNEGEKYVKVLHENFEKNIKEFIIISKKYFDDFLKTEEEKVENGETVEFIATTKISGEGNKLEKQDLFYKQAEFKGSELVGLTYEPLFEAFAELGKAKNKQGEKVSEVRGGRDSCLRRNDKEEDRNDKEEDRNDKEEDRNATDSGRNDATEGGAFRVVGASFVTTEDGTGIVHIAPAFGEDDLEVGKKEGLPWIQHVGMDGKFVAEVKEFAGQEVKPKDDSMKTDRKIVEFLKAQDKVFDAKTYRHSYPHCWRCETPLLNYATSSWFVKVEEIKQRLLENNQKIHWVPEHLKDGRFGKWLEGARDWAISRTRYWGTPLPIWKCENEDCKNVESIGSIEQLEKKTGAKITDIHKHFVDDLTFDCPVCAGKMRRIPEVFDCWFESGSMPYAQKHYPFAYNRKLKNTYYFLRHGEGEHNVNNVISCDPAFGCKNTALTEKGKLEVAQNVQIFKEIKVDKIYSSDFLRTKQTAEILNKVAQTELIFDERLREFNVGEFHGQNSSDYENAFSKKEEKWFKTAKGGETYADLEKRMLEAFNEYESQFTGKTIVIVSHGDPLKILLGSLNGEFKKITAYAHCPKTGVPQKIELKTEEDFQAQYPADFIAEGLDQTRGWFYTLHVLGAALFDKPAFQNVIVNGIVLAEDGQKMSKSKQNYPDPNLIFENYGADAMRFYLMNSPVVKADDLRFSEQGVNEIVKGMILPFWNAYAFFVTYANIDSFEPRATSHELKRNNKLDRWILSALNQLIADVTEEMDKYDLQKAANPIFGFIDNLTNWYIRRSRRRFWKSENDGDKNEAYATLYEVLIKTSQIIAPFMPFLAEEVYVQLQAPSFKLQVSSLKTPLRGQGGVVLQFKNNNSINSKEKMVGELKGEIDSCLRRNDKENGGNDRIINSVHLTDWPEVDEGVIDRKLNAEMSAIQQIVKLGLSARAKAKIKVRQPLPKIQLALSDKYDLVSLKSEFEVIQEELNVKEIEVIKNAEEIAQVFASPNARLLGPKYGKEVQNIIKEAKAGNFEKLENGNYKILDFEVLPEEIEIVYQGKEGFNVEADQGIVIALDTHITEELKQEGIARELVRYIQDMRKEADFKVDARIELFVQTENAEILTVLTKYKNYIINETLARDLKLSKENDFDLEKEFELEDARILMGVKVF